MWAFGISNKKKIGNVQDFVQFIGILHDEGITSTKQFLANTTHSSKGNEKSKNQNQRSLTVIVKGIFVYAAIIFTLLYYCIRYSYM